MIEHFQWIFFPWLHISIDFPVYEYEFGFFSHSFRLSFIFMVKNCAFPLKRDILRTNLRVLCLKLQHNFNGLLSPSSQTIKCAMLNFATNCRTYSYGHSSAPTIWCTSFHFQCLFFPATHFDCCLFFPNDTRYHTRAFILLCKHARRQLAPSTISYLYTALGCK